MKPVECCGSPRATDFCADCGKVLNPLVELTAFCQHERDRLAAKSVAHHERAADEEDPAKKQRLQEKAAGYETKAVRWERYIVALTEK
jgi:hypothetical protein